jgi:hypothetical protein
MSVVAAAAADDTVAFEFYEFDGMPYKGGMCIKKCRWRFASCDGSTTGLVHDITAIDLAHRLLAAHPTVTGWRVVEYLYEPEKVWRTLAAADKLLGRLQRGPTDQ